MKNYRVFLLSIVTFSGIFSIGLGMPVDADTASKEKPKTKLETSPVEMRNKQTSVNAKENLVNKSNTSDYRKLEKPLDLSLPYKAPENAGLKIKQNTPAQQRPELNIFASETIKKSQPLQLNGNLLMSPEPEAGKQKSVDGAGIVINIKP